jgi:hypothetical protein
MKQEIKNREPMPAVLKHVMKQNPNYVQKPFDGFIVIGDHRRVFTCI